MTITRSNLISSLQWFIIYQAIRLNENYEVEEGIFFTFFKLKPKWENWNNKHINYFFLNFVITIAYCISNGRVSQGRQIVDFIFLIS